jgi:hypothetical protein
VTHQQSRPEQRPGTRWRCRHGAVAHIVRRPDANGWGMRSWCSLNMGLMVPATPSVHCCSLCLERQRHATVPR